LGTYNAVGTLLKVLASQIITVTAIHIRFRLQLVSIV